MGGDAPLFYCDPTLGETVLPALPKAGRGVRGAIRSARNVKIKEADGATRRIRREAGRAVAAQFACAEESPGSTEQDAG